MQGFCLIQCFEIVVHVIIMKTLLRCLLCIFLCWVSVFPSHSMSLFGPVIQGLGGPAAAQGAALPQRVYLIMVEWLSLDDILFFLPGGSEEAGETTASFCTTMHLNKKLGRKRREGTVFPEPSFRLSLGVSGLKHSRIT